MGRGDFGLLEFLFLLQVVAAIPGYTKGVACIEIETCRNDAHPEDKGNKSARVGHSQDLLIAGLLPGFAEEYA